MQEIYVINSHKPILTYDKNYINFLHSFSRKIKVQCKKGGNKRKKNISYERKNANTDKKIQRSVSNLFMFSCIKAEILTGTILYSLGITVVFPCFKFSYSDFIRYKSNLTFSV